MNAKVISLIIAGIVVVAGGIGIIAMGGDDDDTNTNDQTSQSSNTDSSQSDDNGANSGGSTDNPFGVDSSALLTPPYQAQLLTEESGRTTDAIIRVDADGDIETVLTDQGVTSEFRIVGGVTYSKAGGTTAWLQFPAGDGSSSQQVAEIGWDEDDLNELNSRTNVSYQGKESCNAGTCRVYAYTDPAGEGTVKIDDSTDRFAEVIVPIATGGTNTITYTYDNVDIVAPENATEFSVPSL